MKRIAVVILNYNGAEMLRRFLPNVLENSPEANVYVADNGSTDNSVETMKREFPQVPLILFDKNHGFAEGYNLAIGKVEEEYALLLNSDVKVSPRWLQPLIDYMDANADVAACQPKILSYRNMSYFEYAGAAGGFMDKWGYPYCRGRIFGTVEKDEGQYNSISNVFWATGAALMVRREIYIDNGGLPFLCPHGGNRFLLEASQPWYENCLHSAKLCVPHRGRNSQDHEPQESLPELSQQSADALQEHSPK